MRKRAATGTRSTVAIIIVIIIAAGIGYYLTLLQPPQIPHPLGGWGDCLLCHQLGQPGVGEQGGLGLPDSHEGLESDVCTECHKPGY